MRIRIGRILAVVLTGLAACTSDAPQSVETPSPTAGSPVVPSGELRAMVSVWDDDLHVFEPTATASRRLTGDGDRRRETRPQIVGDDVLYIAKGDNGIDTIEAIPLAGGDARVVLRGEGSILAFDALNAATIAYLTADPEGNEPHRVGLHADGAAAAIRSLVAPLGRGITEADDVSVFWSPDTSAILVNDTFLVPTPGEPEQTLFVLDRTGEDVAPPRNGTNGRWALGGQVVYRPYSEGEGGWLRLALDAGEAEPIGARAGAVNATVSPDGSWLAYHHGGPVPTVAVFDLQEGQETEIGPGVAPRWLSDTEVAITQVRECEPADECLERSWVPTGGVRRIGRGGQDLGALPVESTLDADVAYG